MGEIPLLLSYALLLLSALVLYLPVVRTSAELTETEVGYLRRGRRGAVVTALTALHADGLVETHPRGGARRTNRALPSGMDQLERAVYGALHDPAGPKTLLTRMAVRRSLDTRGASTTPPAAATPRRRRGSAPAR